LIITAIFRSTLALVLILYFILYIEKHSFFQLLLVNFVSAMAKLFISWKNNSAW